MQLNNGSKISDCIHEIDKTDFNGFSSFSSFYLFGIVVGVIRYIINYLGCSITYPSTFNILTFIIT